MRNWGGLGLQGKRLTLQTFGPQGGVSCMVLDGNLLEQLRGGAITVLGPGQTLPQPSWALTPSA